MKNILFRAGRVLAVIIIAFFANNAKAQTTTDKKVKQQDTVVFTATEMGCNTDKKMVETALYRKNGVKNVTISGETITVVYNPGKVKPDDLKAVIENTGTCEDPNAKVHKVKIKTN